MNKIQCPHCFTDYKISDEQLRLSQGIVRCGKCMETFDANQAIEPTKPVFDPREAFIEPVSHFEDEKKRIAVDDILPDSLKVKFKDGTEVEINNSVKNNIDPDSNSEHNNHALELSEILKQRKIDASSTESTNNSLDTNPSHEEPTRPRLNEDAVKSIRSSFDPELSVDLDVDDSDYIPSHSMSESEAVYVEEPSVQEDSSFVMDESTEYQGSSGNHITEESIQLPETPSQVLNEPSIRIDPIWSEKKLTERSTSNEPASEPTLDITYQQQEIEIEIELEDDIEHNSETIMLEDYTPPPATQPKPASETRLIDEVDQLIDDKIINQPQSIPNNTIRTTNQIGKKKKSVSRFFAWLLIAPLLLAIIITLTATLIYQLWQKQLISWPDRKEVRTFIEPVREPTLTKLQEFGIDVPVRRNLSALQLLSAKTEPHPTRASTLLLRISLVNRAHIDQPLPWLELSLKNSDGKIISRRSLSPKDYIHNNRIGADIGARELKKVTIELLSFPKQAAGYELKLLNK